MSVLVLANPKAKLFRKLPSLLGTLQTRAAKNATFAAPESRDELVRVLTQAKENEVRTVAIAGGDGTAAFIVTEIWSVWNDAPRPRIALLRGGTMNTVARGLGITRGSPENRLVALLAYGDHNTRTCAVLRANGRMGFLFGTGVFSSFLEAYYEAGNGTPGADTAVQVLARFIGSSVSGGPFASRFARRIPMKLTVNAQPWDEGEYLAVAAGTVPEVGLGFRPFPRTATHHDAMELVALRASPRRVATVLPGVLLGKPLPAAVAATLLGDQVTIHSQTAFNFMVDGDLYPAVQTLELDVPGTIDIVKIAGIDD